MTPPLELVRARLEHCGCNPRGSDKIEARCPNHEDHNPSLSVSLGDDGRVLLYCHAGCETDLILAALELTWPDLYEQNGGTNGADAVVAEYVYTREDGAALFVVCRTASKRFFQRKPDGTNGIKGVRRVIYRLPKVVAAVGANEIVYVVEGEKDVHAAERAGVTATCNPMGAGKWRKEYSESLRGAKVTIVADADDAGRDHAQTVAKSLRGVEAEVTIVEPAVGKDISDHLTAGKRLDELVEQLGPKRETSKLSDLLVEDILAKNPDLSREEVEEEVEGADSVKGLMKLLGSKENVATRIVNLVKASNAVLFHDSGDVAYATFEIDGHAETWPVRSRRFGLFARRCFYRADILEDEETERKSGAAASSSAIADAVAQLESEAIFDGDELETHLRVARVDGTVYIDLGDEAWKAIQITRHGWTVVDNPPVRFRRSGGMTALPEPVRGGSLDLLRAFLHLTKDDTDAAKAAADDAWRLIAGWLVASVLEGLPCPVLILHGEQGSTKSTTEGTVRAVIDPSAHPLSSPPKSEVDLMVCAVHNWVVAYDNVSSIEPWMSDAVCRLCTGGGLGKRELFTDGDEFVLDAQRPVIITSVDEVATRGDLLDRAFLVRLPAMDDSERMEESEYWEGFDHCHAQILGGLCDAIVGALSQIDTIKLEKLPRMADAAKWITAAESALGWKAGAFMKSYSENRAASNEIAIEASTIGGLLCKVADEGFTGSMTELLDLLNERADEKITKSKFWPKTPRAVRASVDRLAPNLRKLGYIVEHDRGHDRNRTRLLELRRAQ